MCPYAQISNLYAWMSATLQSLLVVCFAFALYFQALEYLAEIFFLSHYVNSIRDILICSKYSNTFNTNLFSLSHFILLVVKEIFYTWYKKFQKDVVSERKSKESSYSMKNATTNIMSYLQGKSNLSDNIWWY